jgi:hypothetical protein
LSGVSFVRLRGSGFRKLTHYQKCRPDAER